MTTVNEVFCRRDYEAPPGIRLAVDIGANIGIAALYFLTRNDHCRVRCFEPDPKNVRRLRANLSGYEGRYDLEEIAVSTQAGEADFGVEATGRYGGIGVDSGEQIRVSCREINSILEQILSEEGDIDVLKIDVEGLEESLVSSIRPDILARVARIYYETVTPAPFHTDRFDHKFDCQINRLVRSGHPLPY